MRRECTRSLVQTPRYRGAALTDSEEPWTPVGHPEIRVAALRHGKFVKRAVVRSRDKLKTWVGSGASGRSVNADLPNCQGEGRRFEPGVPLQLQGPVAADTASDRARLFRTAHRLARWAHGTAAAATPFSRESLPKSHRGILLTVPSPSMPSRTCPPSRFANATSSLARA
jgi:hypothetical protein